MEEQQNAPVVATVQTKSGFTDFYIPAAIIIAGGFIGAGLFFGGAPQQGPSAAATAPAAEQQRSMQDMITDAGVDYDTVRSCAEAGETLVLVEEDVSNAIETGGRGTPWSIVIGPDGTTYPINGALPTAAINQVLDLARAGAAAPADAGETNTDAVSPVTEADHIKGSIDAPIKVVEYSDFDCPFCTRFHDSMNEIVATNDDVAWVYRHFPLDQLHPNARGIAVASECIAREGGDEAFWKFADAYMQ